MSSINCYISFIVHKYCNWIAICRKVFSPWSLVLGKQENHVNFITTPKVRKDSWLCIDRTRNSLKSFNVFKIISNHRKYFWSVNSFRRTMHSKSPVVNLAEWHETLLVNKWLAECNSQLLLIFKQAVPIHLLIIHCFISLRYSQNINDCIIL